MAHSFFPHRAAQAVGWCTQLALQTAGVARSRVARVVSVALLALLALSLAAAAGAGQHPPDAQTAQPAPAPAPAAGLARWVDLQTANVLGRFRYIETSEHVVTTRQVQDNLALRARLKLDAQARLSVTGVVATGSTFTSGYNNTGIGTGDPVHALSVKQLYLTVVPTRGVDVSYGGLAPIRGESTEITSYDNDAYMVGARVGVRRLQGWFFDEIAGTAGFLGDVNTPNVFQRFDRLDEVNYGQILASKKATSWLTASADLTRVSGASTLRTAVSVTVHGSAAVDSIRYEQYARAGTEAAFGLAVTAEKAVVKRLTMGLGYADIDRRYGGLNGDRYNRGRRVFQTATMRLSPELSLAVFATEAFHNDVPISNDRRFDLVLTYNALATLKRAGVIR